MKKILYKKTLSTLFLILFLLQTHSLLAATYFSSNTPTTWNNSSSWSSSCGGTGGAGVPTIGDDVVICNGHTITLDVITTISSLTVNNGGVLQLSSFDFTVTGTTTIDNGGTIDDNAVGGINTFNTILNNGNFTTTNNVNTEYRFNGNITNNGTFALIAGSPQYQFNSPLIITNNAPSNGNMIFTQSLGSGTCQINANVTIANGTSSGEIQLYGNGGIPIASGVTLTNNYTTGVLAPNYLVGIGTFQNNGRVIMRSNILSDVTNFTSSATSTFEYNYGGNGTVRAATYGNLIINGGGIKTLNIGVTNIKGNLTNNVGGNFNTTTNSTTVTFDGSNIQTIEGATTFHNLTINNSTGVILRNAAVGPPIVLGTPITVFNTLTLANGKLVLGENELTLSGAYATQLSGGSASSYIVTGAASKLTRLNIPIGTQSTLFPIGISVDYTPITLLNLSAAGSVSAYVRDEGGAITPSPKINRIWNISTGMTGTIEVQFDWNIANEPNGSLPATAEIHQNSVAWTNLGISTSYTAAAQTTTAIIPAGNSGTSSDRDFAFFTPSSSAITYSSDLDITLPIVIYDGSPYTISEASSSTGIAFNTSGNKMFILDRNGIIYEYNLSIPFDTRTSVSYSGNFMDVSAQESSARDITFSPNGNNLYVIGSSGDKVLQYSLGSSFNISTSSFIGSYDATVLSTSAPEGVVFNNDGTKMYISESNNSAVHQIPLSIPYNITTAGSSEGFLTTQNTETEPSGVRFNSTGTKVFVLGYINDVIQQYNLSIPFDITTGVTYEGDFSISTEDTQAEGFIFSSDFTKLYTVGVGGGSEINQYSLINGDFIEVAANDGSVEGSLVVKLTGDSFTSAAMVENAITNVPTGLTPVAVLSAANTIATITLTGNAIANEDADDIADLQFTFTDAAFTGGNASIVNNAIAANSGVGIDFNDSPLTQPIGNRGMYFDGIDDQVRCSPINLNNFTIEFWIKTTQTGQGSVGTHWFNGFGLVDSDGSSADYGVALANGKIVAGIGNNVTPEDFSFPSVTNVNDGAWHHVAVTRTGNDMQIYIDGTLNASGSASNVTTSLGLAGVTFGSLQTNNNYFNGQLDEIRVFGSVRTQAQIQTDMASPNANGAVGFWRFEESTGGTTADIAGSNNGNLINSPLWALRVTNTDDIITPSPTMGSLRWAIEEANLDADKDYIDFSIQQNNSLSTILVNSTLDANQPILLDGYSATGSTLNTLTGLTNGTNAALKVELKGSAAFKALTGTHYALRFTGSSQGSIVKGLVINDFKLTSSSSDDGAIRFMSDGCQVLGCFIGTDVTGTTLIPNTIGVGSSGNNIFVGTANAGDRNLIAGGINAIQFNGGIATSSCKAQNNLMGVGANLTALSGTTYGVLIFSNGGSANNNLIGGTGLNEGNIIANYDRGVLVDGNATGNRILGNSIYNNSLVGIILTGTPQGNGGKPAPTISTGSTPTSVLGTCTSCAVNDTIELFRDNTLPAPTSRQGREYLGTALVVAGVPNNTWNVTTFVTSPALGDYLTATITSTGATPNTSPFSAPLLLSATPPTALAATNQTTNSFTANWTSTGATDYEVEISTDGITFTSAGTTSSTSLAIGSLSPNQVYYYRVKSTTPLSAVSNVKFTSTILPAGSGRALTFGGSSQVSVGTSSDYNFNGATNFTLEAWIKTNNNTLTQTIIHRGATSPTTFRNYWFGIAGNQLVVSVTANSMQQDITSAATNGVITNGNWHHVAVTISNTGGVTFYINGISYAGSAPIIGIFNNNPTATLQIGYEEGLATGNSFNGEIDEVKIWNIVRSQTQIRTDMCRKISNTDISSGSYDNMIMYFRFDENTGIRVENRARLASVDALSSAAFTTSGAALGDVSVNDYSSTNLSLISGITGTQSLSVPSIGRTNTAGVHIYRVDSAPNLTLAVPPLSTPVANTEYFGVFLVPTVPVVGIISSTIEYDYGTVPTTSDNIGSRTVNGIGGINWNKIPTTTSGNKLVSTAQSSGEYIPATSFTYYSRVTTGDWSSGTTWSTVSHTDPSCGCTPPIGATVQIAAGHTITRDIPIYSNIITLAGTLDLGEDAMPYTIDTINNSGGTGRLKIGGANSASSIASTTGDFFTTASNVVEFYGDAYTIPIRDYPSLEVNGTDIKQTVSATGTINIYGNITVQSGTSSQLRLLPNLSSVTDGVVFMNGNAHTITVALGTNIDINRSFINGNTTVTGDGGMRILNELIISDGVEFTNDIPEFSMQTDGGSTHAEFIFAGSSTGKFINQKVLYYFSPTAIAGTAANYDFVTAAANIVVYSTAISPLATTYQNLIFDNTTGRILNGTINAKYIQFRTSADLTLSGGSSLNQTGIGVGEELSMLAGSSIIMNAPTSSTVTVNGNLNANGATINVGTLSSTAAHLLDLKGTNNALGTYSVGSAPINSAAIVRYSGTNQQVFASPNYQNLEIAGGGIKSLQGDVTVNKELKLTLGALDISNIPASNLIIGQNATIVNGGGFGAIVNFSPTNFISTSGGVLKKEFSSPLSNFVFPIGEAGKYAPMVADMASYTGATPAILTVKPITGFATNVVDQTKALNKYWVTTTTGITSITGGSLKFYYTQSEVPVTSNESNYIDAYHNGSSWVTGSTANVNTSTNEISFTGLTDFNNITWTAGEFSAFIPTYYSRNEQTTILTGADWNDANTWTLSTTHSGTAATVPPAGATVIIAPTHKIDVNATTINVGTLSLGGELNLRNVPSHTIDTLNDNGGTGNLIFEGAYSVISLPSILATSYKSVATNKITFGDATYTIPQTDYPTLIIDGTGTKSFVSPPSIPIDISGDLLVVGAATFDANGSTVNFTAGNPNPHQIIVDGTKAKFNDIGILGHTTLSLGSTSANLRLCEIAGIMSIGEGITFTNESTIGLDFSSATGNIVDIGFTSVGGTFINFNSAQLIYRSNITPTVTTFDASTPNNGVLYTQGNASPRNATYHDLFLRESRSTTVNASIIAQNLFLDQTSPSLTLVDGTSITINGSLRLIANNPPFATLDFGTGDATVLVNGDLIATNGTIIHNAGLGKTQLLELKGSTSDLGVFTNTSTGISLVKYSSNIIPQTVFPSANYQNLEITGGTVKALQGVTTVNNVLTLDNDILNLNGFDLTLSNTASTSSASTASYIFTGTNQVIKNVSTGSSFTFPIGFGTTAASYAPVTVNYTGAGIITARVAFPSTPPITATNKVNAVWTINRIGLTLGNLVFNWQNVTPTVSSVNAIGAGSTVYRDVSSIWTAALADGNSVSSINASSATLVNADKVGNFAVFSGANIIVTGALSAFTSCEGTPSSEQSYTVEGTNLTNDIVITAPAGFEISLTSGSGFSSLLNLTPTSGNVTTTTIFVRLSSATAGSYGGSGNDITHTSTGATTQNVAIPASSVNSNPTVTLSLLSSPVCPNSDANFVATPIGATYSYVFSVNGNPTPSQSSNTFTRNGLVTGDIVSVIVTDVNGCSASASITMTVADNQAPTLNSMPNFTKNTDPTNCYFTNRTTATATRIPNGIASDNCGVASYRYVLSGVTLGDLSSLEGVRFNKGVTTVSWTATDRNGNVSSPSQFTITVVDAQNPVIQAPQNITRLTNLYGCTSTRDSINLGTPIVRDNCLFRVFNNAPREFPLGETVVTWTAVDSAGNRATAEQIITIEEQYYVIPSDSLILVQMYNEMGGASWSNRWNLNMPVSTWNGISIRCGRVAAINLFGNNLTGVLPRSVLNLARRTEPDFSLNIGGNRLSFESAEDFVGQISNFIYSPQAPIYAPRTETIRQNQSITFTSQTEGNFNRYQWYKNQTPIVGATSANYTIASAVPSDAGIYICEVKNTVATRLTLERSPITLEVAGFVSPTDSLALVQIFEETGGTSTWTEIWDLTQPVSTWEGVTVVGDKIRELDLSSRNMTGRLPNVFDADLFSELRYLSFFDNKLEGEIPTSIGAITTLTYLDLDKNQFEGSVPTSFGNLVNLQSLWLSRNNLTNLPDEIGNMRSLRTLYLNDNKFTSLPETIGNLSELLVLNVSDNELSDLPVSITNLRKLIQFYANRNYIASIPTNIQNLVDLTVFEMNTNNLTDLPNGFLQLSNLSNFRVTENQLEFDDLLPYVNPNYFVFDYAPQAPINEEADILVATNSSVSLTVQTQGEGNVYQWFRDGTSVATTQNFTISRVTNTDAGLYTAQITNPSLPNLTLRRRSIRLNVECQAGQNFGINQPQQTIFCEGQPFGLKLEINEGLLTISQIRWKKDGVILAFANERTYTVTQAGIYTAEIITTNGCTALSNPVEIKVQSKPEVTISLSNEKVLESTLNSPESVTYQWLKDGVAIENAFESTYTPTETAEYSLLVVTQLGCSSVSATIIFTADEVTGIEEPKELRNLVIFPNPNTGNFFIDFGTTTPNGEPSFVLIDAIGKKLILTTERISSTRYKVKTNNLTGGMYYLQIQTKDGLAFRKFVIEE